MEKIKKSIKEAEIQINNILINLKQKINKNCELSAEFFECESEDGDYEVGYTYFAEVEGLKLDFNPDNSSIIIDFKK